ncbi:Hypothetical protein FKW44_000565 [Caligus rogercresseyi]|uniref:Uncharacterized protein n=1 Tax=Caligus rogercresseyi TaxID=217165 RepID=A0A7T8KHH1_CALRO|nr:Hypothetical protein FKW44_000565 [Caligus rogercresseyi]
MAVLHNTLRTKFTPGSSPSHASLSPPSGGPLPPRGHEPPGDAQFQHRGGSGSPQHRTGL